MNRKLLTLGAIGLGLGLVLSPIGSSVSAPTVRAVSWIITGILKSL